jgi:ATP-binding cassette, subfamily B, multidrug efflux pump
LSSTAPKPPKKATKSTLLRLTQLLRPHRKHFVIGLSLTLFIAFLNPVRPYLVQLVLDTHVAAGNLTALHQWVGILLGLLLLQGIVTYFQIITTNFLGQSIINDLRVRVFQHIVRLRMKYFDTTPIGTLQTRAISDIQTLSNVYSEGFVSIFGELLQLVTILAIMLYSNWELTLVILSILPLILLGTYIFKKGVEAAFRRVRKYVSELNAFLQEHITGMLVVQLFNQEAREADKFDALNKQHMKAHLDTVLYYSIFFPVIEIISALAIALLVWYGTNGVITQELTFGTLVAFLLYIQMFFRPIRVLADQFNSLQMGIVSAERVFNVLDNDERIENNPTLSSQELAQSEGLSVRFDKVCFSYNEGERILHEVSFEVPTHTTTAIVGATGSGKSTIVNLLMQFYTLDSGTIYLNNKPIGDYPIDQLKEMMGLVMQDVFLFSGTILENITLGAAHISQEAVEEAAKAVGAHTFISKLPNGYHYPVGERGATLSAGQRQLLAFVRVMVWNPKLLLLDEATANIDTETENLIQQAISTVLNNRTAIIVAHRLSTIQSANQIIVMHKGQIVESGTHQTLLAGNNRYKKLYLLQFGNPFSSTAAKSS